MEDVINSSGCSLECRLVAYITYVELNLVGYFRHLGLVLVTHVVLLLLVA